MKTLKIILALTLIFSLFALPALAASSKGTQDEPYVVVDDKPTKKTTVEEITVDAGFDTQATDSPWIVLVESELAESEVEVLSDITSITDFFAKAKNASGKALNIPALLHTTADNLVVHELDGIAAGGFEKGCGKVQCMFHFPTVYQIGGDVVVVIGVAANPDAETQEEKNITWTGFLGEVVSSSVDGKDVIKVTFTEKIVLAIQAGEAIIVVVDQAS